MYASDELTSGRCRHSLGGACGAQIALNSAFQGGV